MTILCHQTISLYFIVRSAWLKLSSTGMSRRAGSPVTILPKRPRLECSAPSGTQTVEVRERDVSCPVCYDVIISPILQCGEGHLICMDCLGHITQPLKCPTCREPYPSDAPARNRALEQLVAQMTVSCAYCRGKYNACDRDAHNAICSGRPIDCPYTGCHATVPLNGLAEHLREEHGRGGLSTAACQKGLKDSLGCGTKAILLSWSFLNAFPELQPKR